MDAGQFSGIEQELPQFETGSDGFPHSGQVLRYFRQKKLKENGKCWTQRDLAIFLGKKDLAVREMELRNIGLNDINRRRLLAELFAIPPHLFGLATVPERQETKNTSRTWWIQEGFPEFEPGLDGFPLPGQVLRHFRRTKLKENGKPWTQRDLAQVLGKQELAIREMEHRGAGLNDISRRRFLVDLFAIPPVLLGLATFQQEEQHSIQKAFPILLSKKTIQQHEKLSVYHSLLSPHWDAYLTTNPPDGLPTIKKIVGDLQGIVPYLSSQQQPFAIELLCHYHQLTLDMSRDQGNHEFALSESSLAITLAEKIEKPDLLMSAFYRRGLTHFDTGNFVAAYEDLHHAASFTRKSEGDSQLKGMVFLETGRFFSYLARDRVEKLQVERWLEQTEGILQRGDLTEDNCYVRLDRGRFHIGKAATFLRLRCFARALDELDLADRLTKQEQKRRHAYIDILRARVYFAQGELDYATELALSVIGLCLSLHSQSNIADIAQLYLSLKQSSLGNSPLVTRLGRLLHTHK